MDRSADRRENLRRGLKTDDLEALLISSPTNVAYLTGFTGDSTVLILTRTRDLVISDGRFTTQLEQECPGLEAVIRPSAQSMTQAIAQMVSSLAINRLGFEAAVLSVAEHQALRDALKTVTMVATLDRVENLRQIKDEHEIAAVREAIGFAENAFLMVRPSIRQGASEKDIADLLEANLRTCWRNRGEFPADRRGRDSRLRSPMHGRQPPRKLAMIISFSWTGERPAVPIKVT